MTSPTGNFAFHFRMSSSRLSSAARQAASSFASRMFMATSSVFLFEVEGAEDHLGLGVFDDDREARGGDALGPLARGLGPREDLTAQGVRPWVAVGEPVVAAEHAPRALALRRIVGGVGGYDPHVFARVNLELLESNLGLEVGARRPGVLTRLDHLVRELLPHEVVDGVSDRRLDDLAHGVPEHLDRERVATVAPLRQVAVELVLEVGRDRGAADPEVELQGDLGDLHGWPSEIKRAARRFMYSSQLGFGLSVERNAP